MNCLAAKLLFGVFILLINVKMPTNVGILTFMSRIISCSVELSLKNCFITLELEMNKIYFRKQSLMEHKSMEDA